MTVRTIPLVCLAAWVLLLGQPAGAVEVGKVDIDHNGATYTVRFDVTIAADAARASAVLGDYRQWPRLTKAITDSRLLLTHPDGRQRVSVTFKKCVLLVFCSTLRQVKDVHAGADREGYDAEFVPNEGDFRSGKERWRILARSPDTTSLQYRSTFVLGADVPPLVGPWLLKRELEEELLRTAGNLEVLSRPPNPPPRKRGQDPFSSSCALLREKGPDPFFEKRVLTPFFEKGS
jgi:hypothetical protein